MSLTIPIRLVTKVPKFSVEPPLYSELDIPIILVTKVPKFFCKVYAWAEIVTLGLGQPSAGREQKFYDMFLLSQTDPISQVLIYWGYGKYFL